MKVYIVRADVNNYRGIYYEPDDVVEFMQRFVGKPIRRRWKTEYGLKFVPRPEPKGDFPNLGTHIPVLNSKAVKALADLLKPNGELLPAVCDNEKYYLFNVTKIVDALDEENCRLDRFDDGRVSYIEKYSFFEEKLIGMTIFKIPQWLLSNAFVTDTFVQRVEAAGLKGFKFTLVWSSV